MQNGYILILAIGMVMVIIAGHIDLSVGSVAAFVGAMSGVFAVHWGLPWWRRGRPARCSVGALVGAWQGFWIAFVGIPAFIVTLAGMLDLPRPRARRARQRQNIGSFPAGVPRTRQRLPHRRVRRVDRLDPLTLGVGAIAIVALIVQPVRTRHGRRKYSQEVEPSLWFVTKLVLIAVGLGMYFAFALASYKGIPITLIVLAVLVLVYGSS